jgi:hypothetical protein
VNVDGVLGVPVGAYTGMNPIYSYDGVHLSVLGEVVLANAMSPFFLSAP